MTIPFLDLAAQHRALEPELVEAVRRVFASSAFVLGPEVEAFERSFAAFCGAKHCVGTASGTAALTLLLQAHGIGPGDEVITAANTFIATAEAIVAAGAQPVLVDCREEDALIDPAKIEAAITPRTKAVIPVHLYGQPADLDAVRSVADRHHLLVFEDACQAHGALYKGRTAGSLADGAAFSFYPGKNLGACGDAGCVTTDDAAIARAVRQLRDHGSERKYHHDRIGWNERMDGIQGAILSVKLPYLPAWNARRAAIAAHYRSVLPPHIRPFALHPDRTSSHHLFVVRSERRSALQEHLRARGISTLIHYPVPIHLQPAFAHRGWQHGAFPVAEKLVSEILSLPLYPELKDEQVHAVCAAISSF